MKKKLFEYEDAGRIYDAARNVETTKWLVEKSGTADIYSPGFTLLAKVAQRGDLESVRFLLSRKADPNIETPDASVPALVAACGTKGHPEIVKELLSHGANVSASDVQGDSALLRATIRGKVDIVELLLQHDADPKQENAAGVCPLTAKVDKSVVEALRSVFSAYGYQPDFKLFHDPIEERFRAVMNKQRQQTQDRSSH